MVIDRPRGQLCLPLNQERHAHAEDRRKNVVELTPAGRTTLREAMAASEEAERQFLAPLTGPDAQQFRDALRALASG